MHFDEQWMGPAQTSKLAELALQARDRTGAGAFVEIGTWQGNSAIPIASAIYPLTLHVVDHWGGDLSGSIPPEMLARDNKGIFLANVAEAGVNVTVHEMDWRDWVKEWEDEPIAFLHLDASHTRDEVRDNILAVLPLMRPGGILAGDDWDWPEVEAGIRAAFGASFEPAGCMFNKLWWVET